MQLKMKICLICIGRIQMKKTVVNKWNKRTYIVRDISGKQVTLERDDASLFTIEMSEYKCAYREVTDGE